MTDHLTWSRNTWTQLKNKLTDFSLLKKILFNKIKIIKWNHWFRHGSTDLPLMKRHIKLKIEGEILLMQLNTDVRVSENDPTITERRHYVWIAWMKEELVTLDAAIMDWRAKDRIQSYAWKTYTTRSVLQETFAGRHTEHNTQPEGLWLCIEKWFHSWNLLTEDSIKRFEDGKHQEPGKAEEENTRMILHWKKENFRKINDIGNPWYYRNGLIDSDGHISASYYKRNGLEASRKSRRQPYNRIRTVSWTEDRRRCINWKRRRMHKGMRKFFNSRVNTQRKDSLWRACRLACERVYRLNKLSDANRDLGQVHQHLIQKGEYGAYSVREGFQLCQLLCKDGENKLYDSGFVKWKIPFIEDL